MRKSIAQPKIKRKQPEIKIRFPKKSKPKESVPVIRITEKGLQRAMQTPKYFAKKLGIPENQVTKVLEQLTFFLNRAIPLPKTQIKIDLDSRKSIFLTAKIEEKKGVKIITIKQQPVSHTVTNYTSKRARGLPKIDSFDRLKQILSTGFTGMDRPNSLVRKEFYPMDFATNSNKKGKYGDKFMLRFLSPVEVSLGGKGEAFVARAQKNQALGIVININPRVKKEELVKKIRTYRQELGSFKTPIIFEQEGKRVAFRVEKTGKITLI